MHLIVVAATVCYLVMLPLLFLAALGLDQYRARRFRRRLDQERQNYQAQWQALQAQVLAQLQTLREEQAARQQAEKISTR
jgi:cell division protein FtsW (lipid II flippase)